VIPIDQGEELFDKRAKRRISAHRYPTKTLQRPQSRPLHHADGLLSAVQNDPALAAVPKDTFTLDRMLEGSYREVLKDQRRW
jgi:hypothetical protein